MSVSGVQPWPRWLNKPRCRAGALLGSSLYRCARFVLVPSAAWISLWQRQSRQVKQVKRLRMIGALISEHFGRRPSHGTPQGAQSLPRTQGAVLSAFSFTSHADMNIKSRAFYDWNRVHTARPSWCM